MSDFRTRETEASDLRKADKFSDALAIYRDLWNTDEKHFNEWAIWSYAKCAQKCDELGEAEYIVRICVDNYPAFEQGRSLLAWCHYYRHFQTELPPGQPVPSAYWKAAEEVVALCENDPHSKFSPCIRVVFAAVKQLADQPASEVNAQYRIGWLEFLDPDKLGAQGDAFADQNGKVRKVASDRENWYSHMSKALLDAKRYDDCIALCEKALGRFRDFHYNNDVWFGKRIAESKAALGRPEEALADYKRLALQKPEWFLFHDIACLSRELGNPGDALRFAAEAALARSPLHFKSDLFMLLAQILREDGQDDLARQHAQLAASARSEEGWGAKGDRLKQFQEFGVVLEGGPKSKGLARDLERHWHEWRAEVLPRHEGAIDRFNHDRGFGFLQVDGQKEQVFFHIRTFKGPEERLVDGTRVSFFLKESYDNKKGQMSTQAVDVEPLD